MNPWTFTLALYKICPACKKRGQPPFGRLKWFPWDVPGAKPENWRAELLKPRQSDAVCGRCGKKYQVRLSLNPQWGPSDPQVELLLADLLHGTDAAQVAANQLFRLELLTNLEAEEDTA